MCVFWPVFLLFSVSHRQRSSARALLDRSQRPLLFALTLPVCVFTCFFSVLFPSPSVSRFFPSLYFFLQQRTPPPFFQHPLSTFFFLPYPIPFSFYLHSFCFCARAHRHFLPPTTFCIFALKRHRRHFFFYPSRRLEFFPYVPSPLCTVQIYIAIACANMLKYIDAFFLMFM